MNLLPSKKLIRKNKMQQVEPLFIQPLLGPDDAWAGYRVEFAPGSTPDSAALLSACCGHPLLAEFDLRLPWFIPAHPEVSNNATVNSKLINVFATGSARPADEAIDEFEERLRRANNKTAIIVRPEDKLPAAGAWDYLLISASHARTLPPYTLLGIASRTTVVITEVHSHADHAWGQANACSLSTSEYLLARNTQGKKADTTRIKLLEMLGLLADDADTEALGAIFRQEAKLSYSLLRLVNSAALAPRTPITCFSQAINLLGRRQLQRWLQLLVYADPNNGQHPNPLLQKAAARGRLLELLAPTVTQQSTEEIGDTAFMIGVFSLLDTLLNIPMSEILAQLPLPDIAQKALAEHAGPLGELLRAISSAEGGDLKFAAGQIEKLGIDGTLFLDAQLSALSWAAKIRPSQD